MYKDSLNQVGKHLKKNRKDTNHVLNRVGEKFPKIERVRDFLKAAGSEDQPPYDFVMYFKTKRDENLVLLDLLFLPKLCTCQSSDSDDN